MGGYFQTDIYSGIGKEIIVETIGSIQTGKFTPAPSFYGLLELLGNTGPGFPSIEPHLSLTRALGLVSPLSQAVSVSPHGCAHFISFLALIPREIIVTTSHWFAFGFFQ